MHYPLFREEIASFLGISRSSVEILWNTDYLKRSMHNDLRPISALSCSTVYDVLEVALCLGAAGVFIAQPLASYLIDLLADQDDLRSCERKFVNVEIRISELSLAFDQCLSSEEAVRIARFIIISQDVLTNGLCCTNELRDSSRESSMITGAHEQLGPYEVQDHELVGLQ